MDSILNRNLVFVHGKGGVGKTVISRAVALSLSKKSERTLWVTLENPTLPPGELKQVSKSLWHLNCDFQQAFEEYAALKIGATRLTRIFLQNKLMEYMSKAAPGVRELVLLGKIWFERRHYDHVVVDLPSTGYGLALFQSTDNFAKLFRGGPLSKDAESMLDTFRNPEITGHYIVSLPEEMPLQESIELNSYLKDMFPANPAAFVVNRVFPQVDLSSFKESHNPEEWRTPFATTAEEYSQKRVLLEKANLELWSKENISFGKLEFIAPPSTEFPDRIIEGLSKQLRDKAYL
jgi:hypothetical protein